MYVSTYMQVSELNEILSEKDVISIPSNDEIDTTQAVEIETSKQQKEYVCQHCGETFPTPIAKATHIRTQHKGMTKERSSLKEVAATTKQSDVLPESIAYLKNSCLKPFGCKGLENVAMGMLDAPEDLNLLQSLLSANDNSKNIPFILQRYSSYIGKPVPTLDGQHIPEVRISPLKDSMAMMKDGFDMKVMMKMFNEDNNGSKPNAELEILKTQMNTILEQNRTLQQQLLENQRKAEIDKLAEQNKQLAEELKNQKEANKNDFTSLGGILQDYMQKDASKWDMFNVTQKHNEELRKIGEIITEMKNATNSSDAVKMIKEVKGTLTDLGSGAGQILGKSAADNAFMEKANAIAALQNRGFSPEQITQMLSDKHSIRGTAQQEAENLKILEAMNRAADKLDKPIEIPPTATVQYAPPQPQSKTIVDGIQFNVGD